MNARAIAIRVMIVFSITSLPTNLAFAKQGKDVELLARVQQLEKRVAELEQAIKHLRASAQETPRTEAEKKLVGTWVVVDADKKQAFFTDLKLKSDGTCDLVINGGVGARTDAKYRVVGKQIVIDVKDKMSSFTRETRLVSVTDTELVVEQKDGDPSVKVRYKRAK